MFKKSKSKQIDFAKAYERTEDYLVEKIPYIKEKVKEKKKRGRIFKFLKYLSIFILVFFLFIFVVVLINYLNLKSAYVYALNGKNDITAAAYSVKKKDYSDASKYAKSAEDNFDKVSNIINAYQSKFYIKYSFYFSEQVENFYNLSQTAKILSGALNRSAELGLSLDKTLNNPYKNFSSLTAEEKRLVLDFIYKNSSTIEDIKSRTDLAIESVNKVKSNGLLWFFKDDLNLFGMYLNEADEFLTKAIPLSKIMPKMLGYPKKSSFLLVLQNNDELRPTGGFIGTYGLLEIENSDIIRLDTHDVYHMDMPVKDSFFEMPPEPIKEYLKTEQWFMRDSNWSPNWPTSAERILWFYEKENALLSEKDQINNFNGVFDGVIGITPDFISGLLSITGAISIGGVEYNKDNFQDLLQYEVEKGYVKEGVSSWQRKEVIGDISKELKIRILDLGLTDLYKVFTLMNDHLTRKNILIYAHDSELQDLISRQKWGGEIEAIDDGNDYFAVIDSNMGSFKTDRVMNRSINYKVTQEIDGVYADLKVNYSHNGAFDWRTTTYRTFTRVYVPKGSELVRAGGFNNSEKIKVYDELDKTVFAVFLTVDPGEIGGLYFYYKLPEGLNKSIENNEYRLLVQKQPGNDINSLVIDLNFINPVSGYSPTGFYVYKSNDNRIKWETNLLGDREFKVEF